MRLFRLTCLGAFFHVLLLITVLMQMYFDLRNEAMATCVVFFVANGGLAWWSVSRGIETYGIGYAMASFLSLMLGYLLLYRALDRLDYMTFTNQPIGGDDDDGGEDLEIGPTEETDAPAEEPEEGEEPEEQEETGDEEAPDKIEIYPEHDPEPAPVSESEPESAPEPEPEPEPEEIETTAPAEEPPQQDSPAPVLEESESENEKPSGTSPKS